MKHDDSAVMVAPPVQDAAGSPMPILSPQKLQMPGLPKPKRPEFSTGPTAKPPTWSPEAVAAAFQPGRSHRSAPCKAQLADVIERSHRLLDLPEGWICALVPGSDTGALELALWHFLSAERGVDVLAFDSFSGQWAKDILGPLDMQDATVHRAPYGEVPDLSAIDFAHDVVLTWNGTTAGTCLPGGDFIPADRQGLVICDATSATFAIELPYDRLDVVTWSWQKSLGGEGGHGMIALSPRAQARLEAEAAPRGLPKIFTLTKGGKVNASLFAGATINTPSMLAVADHLVGLQWAEEIGGLPALIARTQTNAQAVANFVEASPNWEFLAADAAVRSPTALCLTCVAPRFAGRDEAAQRALLKRLEKRLAELEVAYDIGAYRDAPPGLRLWGGPTVEADDLAALMPWLDWALLTELDELEAPHA